MQNGRQREISDDTAAVREAVLGELDSGNDVVVVTHSYSCIPGTAALSGLSSKHRAAAGKRTSVKRVVILAGFLVPPGTSMLSINGGKLPPQYWHEGDTTLPFNPPGAVHVLYHDLEPAEAKKAVSLLKPQSYIVNTSPIPDQVAGLEGIPVSFLLCKDDNAAPPWVQAQSIVGLREAGIEVHAEEAECGHSPFLKIPKETAIFLRNAAGENLQSPFAEHEVGAS